MQVTIYEWPPTATDALTKPDNSICPRLTGKQLLYKSKVHCSVSIEKTNSKGSIKKKKKEKEEECEGYFEKLREEITREETHMDIIVFGEDSTEYA